MADMWLQLRSGVSSPEFTFLSTISHQGSPIEANSKGRRPPTHTGSRLNSLYLFSLGLLSMRQMEEYCIIKLHAWRELFRHPLPREGASSFCCLLPASTLKKRSGGVASMTRDRGYPDWLVLSARLLRSGYHSAGCVLASGYV